jgi:hypothetical protein
LPADLKVVDLLGAVVAFLRDAGLLGVGVGFLWALYAGKIAWGRDLDKAVKRAEKAETDLVTATARAAQLTMTVERLMQTVDRAAGNAEHAMRERSREDDREVTEVVLAKVKPGTKLDYPPKRARRARPSSPESA